MISKIVFICILLSSPCRIIGSASSGSVSPPISDIGESARSGSPVISYAAESDAKVEVESALPDDIIISQKRKSTVTGKPTKGASKKNMYVLASVLGPVALGLGFLWLRISKKKELFNLDRKAINRMAPMGRVAPDRMAESRAELFEALAKWNAYHGETDNTVEAIKASIEPLKKTIVKDVEDMIKQSLDVVAKGEYDTMNPTDVARLIAAREYCLDSKIKPTLEYLNGGIVSKVSERLLASIFDLEKNFDVQMTELKGFLRPLCGAVPVQILIDVPKAIQPLKSVLDQHKDNAFYGKATYFVDNIQDIVLKLFLVNNACPSFKDTLVEYSKVAKLGDAELLKQLTDLHPEIKAQK